MKRPSFSFYSADFLIGVSDLTNEETGMYIKLLCYQHQKGHLTQKQIGLLLGISWNTFSDELKAKFTTDNNGSVFNPRLEREIGNRQQFVEKQQENGKKGGRPKKETTTIKTQNQANENPKKDIENEIEKEIEQTKETQSQEKGDTEEKTPNVKNHSTEGHHSTCNILDELSFENIWATYGRKGNTKTSQRRWNTLSKQAKQLAAQHIPKYVAATPEIQYRKNLETYIAQEAWNDKIIIKNGTNTNNTDYGKLDAQLAESIIAGITRAKANKANQG